MMSRAIGSSTGRITCSTIAGCISDANERTQAIWLLAFNFGVVVGRWSDAEPSLKNKLDEKGDTYYIII